MITSLSYCPSVSTSEGESRVCLELDAQGETYVSQTIHVIYMRATASRSRRAHFPFVPLPLLEPLEPSDEPSPSSAVAGALSEIATKARAA